MKRKKRGKKSPAPAKTLPIRKPISTLWWLLPMAFAIRVAASGVLPNTMHPDELLQYLEQGHRFAFGYGLIPWEFQMGARSWLLPGFLGIVIAAAGWIMDHPAFYIRAVELVLAAISMTVVALAYIWVREREGEAAGILAGIASAVWFELVYFSTHSLTEAVAAHLLCGALCLAYPGRETGDTRRLGWGGLLLGLACALRLHLSPAAGMIGLLACRTKWRRWLALGGGFVGAAAIQGAIDLITWDYPFQSLITYFRINVLEGFAARFEQRPWHAYLSDFARTWRFWWIPALGLVIAGARRNWPLLAVAAAVIVPHSFFVNKQPRFIFAALPLLLIVISTGLWRLAKRVRGDQAISRKAAAVLGAAVFAPVSVVLGAYYGTEVLSGSPLEGTLWSRYRAERQALLALHERPDVCGVGLYQLSWVDVGYAYLHRDVPFIEVRDQEDWEARAPLFNYVLARPWSKIPSREFAGIGVHDHSGAPGVTIRRRPGDCAPAGEVDLRRELIVK